MVRFFFSTGTFAPNLNETSIILIAKKDGAHKLSDFRPISLRNVTYKIISKLLVTRLRPLLNKCISRSQGAFLPGRRAADNNIIAKELLHSMSKIRHKKKYCAIKLDVQKA